MSKLETRGYSLDDITIVPYTAGHIFKIEASFPKIYMRVLEHDCFPIFTAPIEGLVNKKNVEVFWVNNFIPILPTKGARDLSVQERIKLSENYYVAFSINEVDAMLRDNPQAFKYKNIFLDVEGAVNNHVVNSIKRINQAVGCYDYNIIVGDVVDVETYNILSGLEVNWVVVAPTVARRHRLMADNGVKYPQATQLDKIVGFKGKNKRTTKIIASGGIDNFEKMAKCLALGADSVMIDKWFYNIYEIADKGLYSLNEEEFKKGQGWDDDQLIDPRDVVAKYHYFSGLSDSSTDNVRYLSSPYYAGLPIVKTENIIESMSLYIENKMTEFMQDTYCAEISDIKINTEILLTR